MLMKPITSRTVVFCFVILCLSAGTLVAQMVPDSSIAPWGPFQLIPHPSVANPVLTKAHVTDVTATFVADPFLFHEGDMWYIFFEVLDASTNKGKIGLATSTDGLSWAYDRIVLSESFHLSYPFIFKYNSNYYMVPESGAARQIRQRQRDGGALLRIRQAAAGDAGPPQDGDPGG